MKLSQNYAVIARMKQLNASISADTVRNDTVRVDRIAEHTVNRTLWLMAREIPNYAAVCAQYPRAIPGSNETTIYSRTIFQQLFKLDAAAIRQLNGDVCTILDHCYNDNVLKISQIHQFRASRAIKSAFGDIRPDIFTQGDHEINTGDIFNILTEEIKQLRKQESPRKMVADR
jgi:hypothetical protein